MVYYGEMPLRNGDYESLVQTLSGFNAVQINFPGKAKGFLWVYAGQSCF